MCQGWIPLNEIHNLMATLLTEVCHDVCIEPGLQPVSNKTLMGTSANCEDGAWLDIAANGFWGGTFERTFFDVRACPIEQTHSTLVLLEKA